MLKTMLKLRVALTWLHHLIFNRQYFCWKRLNPQYKDVNFSFFSPLLSLTRWLSFFLFLYTYGLHLWSFGIVYLAAFISYYISRLNLISLSRLPISPLHISCALGVWASWACYFDVKTTFTNVIVGYMSGYEICTWKQNTRELEF